MGVKTFEKLLFLTRYICIKQKEGKYLLWSQQQV